MDLTNIIPTDSIYKTLFFSGITILVLGTYWLFKMLQNIKSKQVDLNCNVKLMELEQQYLDYDLNDLKRNIDTLESELGNTSENAAGRMKTLGGIEEISQMIEDKAIKFRNAQKQREIYMIKLTADKDKQINAVNELIFYQRVMLFLVIICGSMILFGGVKWFNELELKSEREQIELQLLKDQLNKKLK